MCSKADRSRICSIGRRVVLCPSAAIWLVLELVMQLAAGRTFRTIRQCSRAVTLSSELPNGRLLRVRGESEQTSPSGEARRAKMGATHQLSIGGGNELRLLTTTRLRTAGDMWRCVQAALVT